MAGGNSKPGGDPVAPVADEQVGAGIQRAGDVELRDGAGRPLADFLFLFHNHGGAVELVHQPGRDQADHPSGELGGSDEEKGAVGLLLQDDGTGPFLHLLRQPLPLLVQFIQFPRQALGLLGRVGGQQPVSHLGVGNPSSGVQAGAQRKADVPRIHLTGPQAGLADQRLHADARRLVQPLQPPADQIPVLARQRGQVRHRPQRHQVQQLLLVQRDASRQGDLAVGPEESLGQFVGQADPGQSLIGVRAFLLVGVHHGHRRQRLRPHQVVVGDDDVHSPTAGVGDLARETDAAVHGDQKAGSGIRQFVYGRSIQAVPLLHPMGDVRAGLRAQGAEREDQESGGGDAVGVKIPVDGDGLFSPDGLPNPGNGPVHPVERVGIIRARTSLQERPRGLRVRLPAIENLDDHRMEVGEMGTVCIGHRLGEVPAISRGHGAELLNGLWGYFTTSGGDGKAEERGRRPE